MDKRFVRNSLFAALMGVFGVSGTALAVDVDEEEQNQPIASAHRLTEEGDSSVGTNGVTIHGTINNPSTRFPDVDFYSFYGTAGQVLTFRLEAGSGLESILTVFGPPTNNVQKKLREAKLTPQSEPRIDDLKLEETGTYVVAVSPFSVYFVDGGLFGSGSFLTSPSGNYKLTVIPATPLAMPISIDIKPGSRELAPINLKSKGVIPVALLSAKGFAPLVDVDTESLTFGATGEEDSLKRCSKDGVDMNADSIPDMVCHFGNQASQFTEEHLEGILRGMTKARIAFEGRGLLKVVPVKNQKK